MQTSISNTLFLSNIKGKIKRPLLKQLLYALCSPYGQILDIVIPPRAPDRLRGIAFIVFKDSDSVQVALKELHSFQFMGRPLRGEHGGSKSRATKEYEMYVLRNDDVGLHNTISHSTSVLASNSSREMEDMDIE